MHSSSILVTAALEYAARGWRVMPLFVPTEDGGCSCGRKGCKDQGKHPRIRDWPRESTDDADQIRKWWGMWPASNIGIACGARSGFWVLDIDGEEGLETLRRAEARAGALPETVTQLTGGGGQHRLFAYRTGLKNAVKFAPGLDVRTDGGLIVVEPSLHVSGNEYRWELSAHPDDVFLAAAPDWLLEKIRRAGGSQETAVVAVGAEIKEGGRNAALFRMGCAMRRRGMTETEIGAALSVVNRERVKPSLDDSEIADIARKSCRYEPAADGVNGRNGMRPNSLNSLNSYGGDTESEPEPDRWPAPLAPEAFHGIAGEVARLIAPSTEADIAGVLVNFLVAMGALLGRGPYATVGATVHHLNLFACLVGPSGAGRKGTSWDPIKHLLWRVSPSFVQEHLLSDLSSGEGLIAAVKDRIEKRQQIKDKKSGRMTMEFETVVEDEGISDKRQLVVVTEFANLLKVMNRAGNTLSPRLREAWDSGDMQIQTRHSPIKATGAHISLLAHITPTELLRHLSETEAASGFGNRFLWVAVKRSQLLPEGGSLPSLNSIILSIHKIIEQASDIAKYALIRDEQAKAVWAVIYERLTLEEPGLCGDLIARAAAQVLRLSGLYAVLDGLNKVNVDHLLAAVALWDYCEASVRCIFGDATGNPLADQLWETLANRPEGTTKTDLHHECGRNKSAAELNAAMGELRRAGRLRVEKMKTEHDRTVDLYFAVKRAPTTDPGHLAAAKEAAEALFA